jgi:hypothetical protein
MGWHWYLEKFDAEVSGRPAPGDSESARRDRRLAGMTYVASHQGLPT